MIGKKNLRKKFFVKSSKLHGECFIISAADPLSDCESSFLTGYDKISAGGPICTVSMSQASGA